MIPVKFLVPLLLSLLLFEESVAQSYSEIIKPSPDVVAFEKYGNIPVSLYTGVPEIKVPIYEIRNKEIAVPVSLSYHAGGITVNEEASRVGLGWILQSGGMISRTIRGIDDFRYGYGYLKNSVPEIFNSQVAQILSTGSAGNVSGTGECEQSIGGQMIDFSNVLYASDNDLEWMIDMEPDLYNYNFLGYTGSFTINKDLSIVSESKNSLRIELLMGDSTWLVTTPDGVKYYFDTRETNNFFANHANTTSWYLTKIISPTGAIVTFHYSRSTSYQILGLPRHSEKTKIYTQASINALTPACNGVGVLTYELTPARAYINVLLDSITYPFGSTYFTYMDRSDLSGEKRLSLITVNKKGQPEKTEYYQFKQDYFTATSTGGHGYPTDVNSRKYYNKRLKLNSLVHTTADSVKETYTFTYNTRQLPSKGSYAVDHWGFYNGATSNNAYTAKWGYISSGVEFAGSADREANSLYATSCMLNKVIYPSGGSTTFEYESNDFDIGNSINTLSQSTHAEYKNYDATFLARRYTSGTEINTSTLEIKPHTGSIALNVKSMSGSAQTVATSPSDMYFEIYPEGSSTYLYRFTLGTENAWNSHDAYYNYYLTQSISLSAGKYQVKTLVKDNVLFLNYITINFSYSGNINLTTNHDIRVGGGVRIRKITSTDPVTGKEIIKKYQYHYEADTDGDGTPEEYSYGRRLSNLDYINREYSPVCYQSSGENSATYAGSCNSMYLYSDNVISSKGPLVGYDKVIEVIGESGEGGKTEYSYYNYPDVEVPYASRSSNVPAMRPAGVNDLSDFKNGLLKERVDFKFNDGGTYTVVSKKMYTYETLPIFTKLGIRRGPKMYSFAGLGACGSSDCEWIITQYPAFQSGLSRMLTETETLYNGVNELTVTSTYQYEPGTPIHYNPVKISRTKSDGSSEAIVTIYPSDYASGIAFTDSLMQAHILAPIETVRYSDKASVKTITSGIIKIYYPSGKGLIQKEYTLDLDAPLPISQFKFSNKLIGNDAVEGVNQQFNKDAGYKELYAYNFNANDDIVEIIPARAGLKKSYVWGYDKILPVAEATNANVNQIYYQGFEDSAGTNVSTTDAKTGKKSWSGNFVIPAGDRPVSGNYTIEYWEKTGSAWTHKVNVYNGITPSQISSTGLIDDIRIYPIDAVMKSFTYEPLSGITSSIDERGDIRYYEYDAFKRLRVIRDKDKNILKTYEIHFKID